MLRFTSCQAEIAESFCTELTIFIGQKLGIETEFVGGIPWQEREKLFDRGEIDVCWMCGLPYVRKSNSAYRNIELLAAHVMKHERYAEKPVYYSDVVVHSESPFRSFDDLRGATWAYNEAGSHSGYNLVRYHLAMRGMTSGYFGRVIESGSHQDSVQMILKRSIDATAIDSTVLEMEINRDPAVAGHVRKIAVLGPSPAPPWLVHRLVSAGLRHALRLQFLEMHKDPRGRQILEDAGVLRFAAISDEDYDPIREMDRVAGTVEW